MIKRIFYDLNKIPNLKEIMMNNFDETLKINKTSYITKRNDSYSIIRYNKNLITNETAFTIGQIKCLILNDEKKAVGFAPPKSIDFDTFKSLYPEKTDCIVAEEFIDGVMINLFWNPKIGLAGGWEIATRNSVGADIFCSNKKIYSALFKDALNEANLDVHQLSKSYSYSFVMQHPSFSCATKIDLYLIEIYEIIQTENNIILVFQLPNESCDDLFKNSTVKFSKILYDWNDYQELKNKYASANTYYSSKGVVLRNIDTGHRSKIQNPTHERVLESISNKSAKEELLTYLILRNSGKIKEFLTLHPEKKRKFGLLRKYIHDFTKTLHQNYLDCYVKKIQRIDDFRKIFRTHLQRLHEIYINGKKQCITIKKVIDYVNKLSPDALFFCLDQPLRDYEYDSSYIDDE
jgi:hypothetical protein